MPSTPSDLHTTTETLKPQQKNAGEANCDVETYYPLEEVRKHNRKGDCWIIIDDKVYDVSKWASRHPGGSSILNANGGKDATDVFHAMHNESLIAQKMKLFQIGKLLKPYPIPPLVRDFRALKAEIENEGLMNSSKLFFLGELLKLFIFYAIGVSVVYIFPVNIITTFISACITGFSWGLGGWLQHDFGHLAVFEKPRYNQLAQVFTSNFLMGGSAVWWRGRHNRHHVDPNKVEVDLDIRTLPLFAWDAKQAQEQKNGSYLQFQHLYFFLFGPPLLMVLYKFLALHWVVTKKDYLESFTIFTQAVYCYYLVGPQLPNIYYFAFWFFLCWVFAGAYMGTIFASNHNMHPLLREEDDPNHEMDYVKQVAITTQDLDSSPFMDWFTGHLTYQVEHHLFPRMPRHNYPVIHDRLTKMYKKHGVKLLKQPFLVSLREVVNKLYNVGTTVKKLD